MTSRLLILAQSSNLNFGHFTTDNGLSSNKVEAVIQDHEGFYWIATQNGLNRYDGSSFKIFQHHANDSTSLIHNYCLALVEDDRGDIWVATLYGVCRFIRSKGYFQTIRLPGQFKDEKTLGVYNMVYDGHQNIWISGTGLWRYNLETNRITYFEGEEKNQYAPSFYNLIKHIAYDEKHQGLWFSAGGSLNFFDAANSQFYNSTYNPKQWKIFDAADPYVVTLDRQYRLWFRNHLKYELCGYDIETNSIIHTGKNIEQGINQIYADSKSRIWLVYWLIPTEIFDPQTGTTDTSFFAKHHRYSMQTKVIKSLYVDRQENFWISSFKGISIYQNRNQYFKRYELSFNDESLKEGLFGVYALAQTDTSHLWLATNQGLFQFDKQMSTIKYVNFKYANGRIKALKVSREGLWMGINDKLVCLDVRQMKITHEYLLKPGIIFIQEGINGDYWIGLWSQGLYRVNLKNNLIVYYSASDKNPSTIKYNSLISGLSDDHKLWIGYNGEKGFSDFDFTTQIFSHHLPDIGETFDKAVGTITAITHVGSDYWMGSYGGGMIRFDPVNNTYEYFQQEQGLASNYINNIIPDQFDNLWISTSDGMNYFDTHHHTLLDLNIAAPFRNNEFQNTAIHGLKGKLYFAVNNEIIEVDPAAFVQDSTFPSMVISDFKLFDKAVPLPEKDLAIRLSYRENYFSFAFSGIKTNLFKKSNYAYMLEGFDKNWILSGSNPYAGYTNVPDGHYRFVVKATNDNGQWSDILLSREIYIQPPYWRTWWFLALCISVGSGFVYLLYQYRIQQIKKVYSVRTQISRDLHDDIGASLSSINIYSTVAESELKEHPDKTKAYLQQINLNSREVMEQIGDIVWANRTGGGDLSTLESRIKNFGYDLLSQKNIDCLYSVDPMVEKKLTRPEARRNILMIIKEALHNMAKYSEATEAAVSVSFEGSQVQIFITDNGKGFDPLALTGGNGMENMKKRAEMLKGTIEVNSVPGNGTTIRCLLPTPTISG
ncbi:MAG: two-component regulator propeller domain-containing protein [Saprospiraceae bacterium]